VLRRLARDRSALLGLILVLLVVLAILAPVISTHRGSLGHESANRLKPPGGSGCSALDRMGADIYSRVIYGARITLLIAFVAVGASLLIGVPIEAVGGLERALDRQKTLMRVVRCVLSPCRRSCLRLQSRRRSGPSIEK
jgi:peptide/nickel transport system permease protein